MWSRSEQRNAKIPPPLSATTKLDFVFTRPGPVADARLAISVSPATADASRSFCAIADVTLMAHHLSPRSDEPSEKPRLIALFDADLEFEIQGDAGVLPWIGRSDFPRKQQKRIVLQYREIDLFESGSRMPLGKATTIGSSESRRSCSSSVPDGPGRRNTTSSVPSRKPVMSRVVFASSSVRWISG